MTILSGSNVTLLCVTEGYPSPEVSWVKDGNAIQNKADTLSIPNSRKSDQGRYVCTAKNSFGSDSKASYVTVLSKYIFLFLNLPVLFYYARLYYK